MRWRRLAATAVISVASCRGDIAGAARPDADSRSAPVLAGPVEAAALVPDPRSSEETRGSWHGSYKSQSGTLYVPADWKGVRWNVPESSAGLGDGTIRLTLEPDGRIRGTLEGPLGPAVVAGLAVEGALTASIRPQNPTDRGFGGTLTGKVVDGHVEGTIHVSPGVADAVRVATFMLGSDDTPGR
jgi:hypothetical protein